MNSKADATAVNEAAKLGAALAAPQTIGYTPFVVVPESFNVHNLENYLRAPLRKRGNTVLNDAQSFILFVQRHKVDGATSIYGSLTAPSFKAVFNDDGTDVTGWGDHTATYACPLSVEWKTWTGANKKVMNQETFAQFIEDNAPDCATPTSADMIEIARTLEAKKKVNFASGIRLSNGQNELTYEEEITGTASKGKLPLPEVFVIGIPVLEGGDRYAVNARLRYRIADGGKLSMWFDLERPHKVLEDAARGVWAAIAAGTGIPILNGAAPT